MVSKKAITKLTLVALLSGTAAAQASQAEVLEQAAAATQEGTAKHPGMHYLDEMAIMDAQIAYLRKEGELRSALEQRSRHEALPKVVSIVGSKGSRSAQVVFESGIMRWLKTGDALAGGLKVVSIGRAGVNVGDERDTFPLPFVSANQNGMTGGGQAGMVPLAPPPNLNIVQPMPMPAPGMAPAPGPVGMER